MKNKIHVTIAAAAVFCLIALLMSSDNLYAARDSKGTEFWIAFPGNYARPTNTNLVTYYQELYITSEVSTSGTVSVPGAGISIPFSVSANSFAVIQFPYPIDIGNSDTISNRGVHVTSDDEVTVYGLNKSAISSDGFLALPVDVLGNEYQVLGYSNVGEIEGNQFLVVGTVDGTVVTITPSVTVGIRTAGVPYDITLNEGETYLLRDLNPNTSDLSGTKIVSTEPVGVFGGHRGANIPRGFFSSDHLVEMIPPVSSYGRSFAVMPLATRVNGDYWRVLASRDSTIVQINGVAQSMLNANQFLEVLLTDAAFITSDRPVLVAQYSASSSFDGVFGDPFMMLVPPHEQYCSTYVISAPLSEIPFNFLNITAPNEAVGSVILDNTPIPVTEFTPIPGSDFSYARVPVSQGGHVLNSAYRFGCLVYGFDSLEAYGYPGGTTTWRIADVVGLEGGPEISTGTLGTEHCVTAFVYDTLGTPLAGIRVDFEQRGANPGSGYSYTNDSGLATHCYTGVNSGVDTIICRYYEQSDTLLKFWDDPLPVELTSFVSGVRGRNVTLNWATSGELNNAGFDIERSSLEGAWSKIGNVRGSGSTSEFREYEFTDLNLSTGTYKYRLKQIDFNGNYEYFELGSEVSIGIPEKFELNQNFPNPFNPSTKISFALAQDGYASIKVYDISGRLTETLIENFIAAGYHTTEFNAANLSSGVYFCRLEFRNSNGYFTSTMRMTLLK